MFLSAKKEKWERAFVFWGSLLSCVLSSKKKAFELFRFAREEDDELIFVLCLLVLCSFFASSLRLFFSPPAPLLFFGCSCCIFVFPLPHLRRIASIRFVYPTRRYDEFLFEIFFFFWSVYRGKQT